MSRLMTSGDLHPLLRYLAIGLGILVLGACGPNHVQVEGAFPEPVVEPIPISLGVWFSNEFRNHEFHDEAKTPGSSDWIVNTGASQVDMWNAVLSGMFTRVVLLEEDPTIESPDDEQDAAAIDEDLDAIFIPRIEEFQYAIPKHTNIKVYEIWMRYRLGLIKPNGESISEWSMTSYGKTPTAFLQSDEAAVNLAAVMALRDAGANFASSFANIAEVSEWLETQVRKQSIGDKQ